MNSEDIISKYNLKKKTWTYKGFHGILHSFFPVGEEPLNCLKKYFGDSFKISLFFIKEDYCHWYWNDEDMIRIRKSLIAKVRSDPTFLTRLLNDWHKRLEIFNKCIKECEVDFTNLSDENILDIYDRFYKAYVEEYSISIGLQDPFSMHADKFMKPLFEKFFPDNANEMLTILTSPVNESFINKEFKERMLILKELKKENKNKTLINELLTKHSKKYFWIENNYAKFKVLTRDDFKNKLTKELHLDPDTELARMHDELENTKKKKRKILPKLPDELKTLVEITELFAYMQDERKKYVLISNHYQEKFMLEIGKRLNLTDKEMYYTIQPELRDMLINRNIDKEKLKRRYNHSLVIQTLKGYEIYDSKAAEEVYNEVFAENIEGDEIKGTCASPGKAKGVVRIIKKTHDLANFTKGDILVASMTRPEMIPAIEKCAAIVTDEGGITSHAAIVSREMKVPCIIGTKSATQVFNDGNLVEVDADNGIVKRIK